MPAGLQLFNASGNLIVDISDRISRVIGQITTTTSDGSITVPEFSLGTPWVMALDQSNDFSLTGYCPRVYADGNQLVWDFPNVTNKRALTVIYGVY